MAYPETNPPAGSRLPLFLTNTWATEIKVRAERKAGEMLRATAESGERAKAGSNQHTRSSHDATTSLSDLGISRDQSSRWQQVASIPDEHFEAAVSMAKNSAGEVTTAFLLREARKGKPKGKPKTGKAAQERMRQLDEAQKESMFANYLHIAIRLVKLKKQFTESETALYTLEREARIERRGLWSEDSPLPPWEFRRRASAGG